MRSGTINSRLGGCAALLVLTLLAMASAAEPSSAPPARQLQLVLPENLLDLPRVSGTRHIIYKPKGNGADFTYHHNPLIEHWRGRFYVAWSTTPRSEWTDPFRALVSSSLTGTNWSEPLDPFASGDAVYKSYMNQRFGVRAGDRLCALNCAPRNFLATPEKLYLWTLANAQRDSGRDWVGRIAWTDDGKTWHELAPQQLDGLEKEKGLGELRLKGSNKKFIHLHDGRLLAAAGTWFPITSDPTGLTGWTGPRIDLGECTDPGEPNAYEGPDGVLHGTVRFGTTIWHTYSTDAGQNWTPLTRQPKFTDNPGNKDFGTLPNGSIWYVGGPRPGSRMELVLGLSKDGWTFDRNYLVRWETITPIWYSEGKSEDRPGYKYPAALCHDGFLYVVYSRTRDYIELTRINLTEL